MAFCKKCGTELGADSRFCPSCGAPTGQEQSKSEQNTFAAKFAELNNTADTTAEFDPTDIEQNKWMALLAYLGPLVFIPMFAVKGSKFARYHANQGLTLFIASGVYSVIQTILTLILMAIFPLRMYGLFNYSRGGIYTTLVVLLGLAWVAFVALTVIGIINAVTGRAKELPIIGRITFLK